jgi:hypothetical protein
MSERTSALTDDLEQGSLGTMDQRGNALAERLEQGALALFSFASTLTDEE